MGRWKGGGLHAFSLQLFQFGPEIEDTPSFSKYFLFFSVLFLQLCFVCFDLFVYSMVF